MPSVFVAFLTPPLCSFWIHLPPSFVICPQAAIEEYYKRAQGPSIAAVLAKKLADMKPSSDTLRQACDELDEAAKKEAELREQNTIMILKNKYASPRPHPKR